MASNPHWLKSTEDESAAGMSAFPVDEVHGIQRFQKTELKEPPATISKSALTYTQGVFAWRERSVGLLDTEPLFHALNRSLS